jgi:hypothetical protein
MSGTNADGTTGGTGTGGTAGNPGVADTGGTGAGAPWYQGKVDAGTIGLWQNKGWVNEMADPAALAVKVTQSYSDLEKHFGVPHDEIVRFPKQPGAPEWQAVWDRLGVPKDPTGYDFSQVKRADGTALDPAAELALRAAAHKGHVPASEMAGFASEFVKYFDTQQASQLADATAQLETQRAALKSNWGANFEVNKFVAAQGAKALGLDAEMIEALERTSGYAKTMEAMRRIGAMNGEDKYVAGSVPGNAGVMTREQAVNQMEALKRDPVWRDKLLKGDHEAGRQFASLSLVISGGNG